ncbi:unnamed protein product, partial [Larinioides sclopetarius]
MNKKLIHTEIPLSRKRGTILDDKHFFAAMLRHFVSVIRI